MALNENGNFFLHVVFTMENLKLISEATEKLFNESTNLKYFARFQVMRILKVRCAFSPG